MKEIKIEKKISEFEKPKDWREFMAVDKTWRWTGLSKRRWINDWTELTPVQRCLMTSLWLYAGKKGKCWASMRTLAKELKVARNTILRNIKILKEKKFIKIEKINGRKGNYHYYTMLK